MMLNHDAADFNNLKKFNTEQFSELLDVCFKFLTGKEQPSQCLLMFKKFCDNCEVELLATEPLIKNLLNASRDAVKGGKTISQLQTELTASGMSEEYVYIFTKEWEKHYSSLAQASSKDMINVNQLIDMEWKFGVSSASSELNTVGNVFLQLKMEIEKDGCENQTACFELSLPEFFSFLHQMERARASLEYLN